MIAGRAVAFMHSARDFGAQPIEWRFSSRAFVELVEDLAGSPEVVFHRVPMLTSFCGIPAKVAPMPPDVAAVLFCSEPLGSVELPA
jgi:hypothetical protein